MVYTDYTYYNNEINVPDQVQGDDRFASIITRYEPDILKALLGYQLYTLLEASPSDARFVALIEGAEFSFDYCGSTINTKWEGLQNDAKISLLSYYVYYTHRNQNEQFYSNYGQAQSNGENSIKIDVRPKLIYIWNLMIDLYGVTPNCLLDDNYFLSQNRYEHYNALPSAYNFLLANKDTYPEWVFKPLDYKNNFGI